jgi:hypothetical protein
MTGVDFCNPWLDSLYYTRLRFYYRARDTFEYSGFIGFEIRGSLGHQLKLHTGCRVDNNHDCRACSKERKTACAYAPVYTHSEKVSGGMALRIDSCFRSTGQAFRANDSLRFDLILPGRNSRHAGAFFWALRQYPLRIGPEGNLFTLQESGFVDLGGHFIPATHEDDVPVYRPVLPDQEFSDHPADQLLEMTMATPAEITLTHGRYVRKPEDLTFKLLVARMLGRLENVMGDHCDEAAGCGRKKRDDYKNKLLDLSNNITIHGHDRIAWRPVKIRNNSKRKCGGLVGALSFQGEIHPFLPLLKAIEVLGVGKNTSAGFGQIGFCVKPV